MLNEYDVSRQSESIADFTVTDGSARVFSKRFDSGNGISLFLNYRASTRLTEYELSNPAPAGFAEYEVVGSSKGPARGAKPVQAMQYTAELGADNNFYVESFEDDSPVVPPKTVPLPGTTNPQECSCKSPNPELPSSPGAGAIPLAHSTVPVPLTSSLTSRKKTGNKLLDAISEMESAPNSGDEINDSFLEDIKTILTDPKVAKQQFVEQPPSNAAAQPTSEEDIFDRIARNMQYANQYDFGTVELEQRFDSFDREDDKQPKIPVRPKNYNTSKAHRQNDLAGAVEPSPSDFLEDLDLINLSAAKETAIPLDPGVGGRSILPEVLTPGDIILSTTTDSISETIRSATGSAVSHASMYVGNGKIIHATDAGVQEWGLDQLMDACSLCVAYHHRDMDEVKAGKIVQFLKTALANHAAFDGWGLIHAAPAQLMATYCDSLAGSAKQACLNSARSIRPGTDNSDQFFCSELIFAALKDAGLTISTVQPSFSSPQEAVRLFYDGTLQYVGHLKV